MPKRNKNEKYNDKMKHKFNSNTKQASKSMASTNPDRVKEGNPDVQHLQYRTKSKIKLLNLYNSKPNLFIIIFFSH